MTNPIAKGIGDLMGQAQVARTAAEEHGATIPLATTTVENLGSDADALTTARNNHEAGKVVLASAFSALMAIALTVRAFLTLGRETLKPHLGTRYSPAWNILGFSKDLAISMSTPRLLVLLQAYKAYYTANPAKEVAALNLTAVHAQALYEQLSEARLNADTAEGQAQALRIVRDAAADDVRKQLRLLITELNRKLGSLDPRWLEFGFNKPGAQSTPAAPQNVTATLVGGNGISLKWARAARAEYYRVYAKVNGVDEELIAIGSPADLAFALEGLPAATKVELAITAVNDGGESVKSAVVTITTT